jgi:hypothetical protein
MQSPEPLGLAEHWGRIIGIAVTSNQRNEPELKLPNADFHFVKGATDLMSGLTFRVRNIARVCESAAARGCTVANNAFRLGGVTFRLVA